MRYKKTYLFFLLLYNFSAGLFAQKFDSFSVQFNQVNFKQGDSIYIDASLIYKSPEYAACTLNLCVESLKTGKKWKYRYPMIAGFVGTGIQIDTSIADGTYAFNFQVQPAFFQVDGFVQNPTKNDSHIRCMLCTKNMQVSTDTLALDEYHHFKTGRLLFQDSAVMIFSRLSRKKNDLNIVISTPLDSLFSPTISVTRFITIGQLNEKNRQQINLDTSHYQFVNNLGYNTKMLTEVKVIAKTKKLVDAFAAEHVTPLFSSDDAVVLDGLESNAISNCNDILSFIRARVAGFEIEIDEFGAKKMKKRKQHAAIYINEIKVTEDELENLNPSDVALIKVFRPGTPVAFSLSEGGAIAVYTKMGAYAKSMGNTSAFPLRGYSALDLLWK